MKLFVRNPQTQQKEYLPKIAASRNDLAQVIGSQWFNLNGNQYHVHQVIAESDSNTTNIATGAAIGFGIGLFAGPIGALIGAVSGSVLGNESDKSELQQINFFNQSVIQR